MSYGIRDVIKLKSEPSERVQWSDLGLTLVEASPDIAAFRDVPRKDVTPLLLSAGLLLS